MLGTVEVAVLIVLALIGCIAPMELVNHNIKFLLEGIVPQVSNVLPELFVCWGTAQLSETVLLLAQLILIAQLKEVYAIAPHILVNNIVLDLDIFMTPAPMILQAW